MSLFGAMDTAISGLTAQSTAFGNISDNVANSQSVGFKQVDTAFVDYLTTSNGVQNLPGATVARPIYANNVQGTIAQSNDPLALAVDGQGFFPVSQVANQSTSTIAQSSFSSIPYYTRAGDFSLDKNGYMVNSSGEYLNGWSVDPTTGVINRNQVSPIQISQTVYNPVATSTVTLSANLPATPVAGATTSSQVTVYDALGTSHTVDLTWTQNATSDWTVAINVPDDTTAAARGTAEVKFGAVSGNPVSEGTVGSTTNGTGSVAGSTFAAGSPATLSFTTNFGSGNQALTLNLGNYGSSSGLTQYAGSNYALNGLTQDGVPPGSYSGVAISQQGDVVINYNNGQSRTISRIPLVTFNNPDGLQRQNGQAFTASLTSGLARTQDASTNGAGNLVTNSVEQSNVDIATEFTKLIVAQQAYSANTKMVTTANDMLTATIDMKR